MALFGKKKIEEKEAKVETHSQAKVKSVQKKTVKKSVTKPAESKKSMKELYAEEAGETTKVIKTKDVVTGKVKIETKKIKYGQAYRILVRPLVTEKGSALNSINKYLFEVASKANKIEIAKAVNEVYGIMPSKVNIVKMIGKKVRRGKISGQRKDWKKAIVTLPQGKTIDIYEGV